MKTHMLAIACVVMALCLLTACQPTPEEPVVVNKNDSKLEEKMQETPLPQTKYEVPRSWKENVEVYNGKLKIEIDADIEIPDVKAYPVLKVVPGTVSQEMADKIVSILYGDIPVYELEKRS